MGYSLCMMADFQNGLISGILRIFWRGFLHRTIYIICRMNCDIFFGVLIFDSNGGFCLGYRLCMMADFQNGLISGILRMFWRGFLHRTIYMICRMNFDIFFGVLIFDSNGGFCMDYSLCMMADFQNGLISRIFSVFWSGFLFRTTVYDL